MIVKVYNKCWWDPQSGYVQRYDGETDAEYLERCGFPADAKLGDHYEDDNFVYRIEEARK